MAKIICILSVMFGLFALPASAQLLRSHVLYVDPQGSDTYAVKGDPGSPWQTLAAAKKSVKSGDLIFVFPGNYADVDQSGAIWYFSPGVTGVSSNILSGGNGLAITNVGSLVGQPRNLNLNALTHFWTNVAGSGPIRILTITDLSGFPGGREFIDSFTGLSGYGGSGSFGFGGVTGDPREDFSAGVTPATDFNSFPFSQNLKPLAAGQSCTYSRRSGGTGITDTNFYSDTLKAEWLTDTNGGTFTLQVNVAGGGWTTVKTLSSLESGTNAASTNVSVALNYNSVRCLGVSGISRIISLGEENSTSNSYYYSEVGIQGRSLADVFSVAPVFYYAAFTNLNPSLILLEDMDSPRTPAYWANVVTWITNTMPNADIVVVNNHVTEVAEGGYNYQAYTNALLYGLGHWDTYFYLGTNAQALTNAGLLLYQDTAHLGPLGTAYLNNRLWGDVVAPFLGAYDNGGFQSSRYQGSTANLFNNARTNSLGVGLTPVSTSARFTIQPRVGTGLFQFDDIGGSPSVWIHGAARTSGNYNFQAGQGGAALNINEGSGSSPISFASGNQNYWTMWSSGGMSFGTFPSQDPGNGSLGVAGSVITTNMTGFLNADATVATTTLGNLVFNNSVTVASGKKYRFILVLLCADSTAADGCKFDFNGGSAPVTNFRVHGQLINDTGGATALAAANSTTLAGVINATAMTTVNQHEFRFEGTFEPSGGGTFIPRFAQNAHSTGTLTIFRGSNLTLTQCP